MSPSVERRKAIRRVRRRICDQEVTGSIPGRPGRRCSTTVGIRQVEFFGDDAASYRITSITRAESVLRSSNDIWHCVGCIIGFFAFFMAFVVGMMLYMPTLT